MKNLILISISVLILIGEIFSQGTKRVLFLGNSYTAVNNLPQLTANVALSAGDTLIYDSNAPGGYTLQGHSTNATSLNKINLGNWDFVVLQEQSQLPSFPDGQVQSSVFPYARILDSIINSVNNCTETMFFMTWGRKNGDASNCSVWPPVCTYQGMDSLLYLRYMMMTDSNHAVVSAVGRVWNYLRNTQPLIDLYQTDGSHPSVAGSYAAACCFYSSIFRKDPTLITFNSTLSSSDASIIRSAVKTVIYDSILNWRIGSYDPAAAFTYQSTLSNFSFSNTSTNATQYYWSFGDGDTSTFSNPSHTYIIPGTYTVTLQAGKCGITDTISAIVNVLTTNIHSEVAENIISAFPNPVSGIMKVKSKNSDFQSIYATDLSGNNILLKFFKSQDETLFIDVSELTEGVYFLQLFSRESVSKIKIIKQ
ncbi:MAG: PKD domain-containing protein [Bacteroidota bacterium]|jgi:hypothetical protein